MKSLALGRYTLSASAAAAMLAGCGGSQPLIGAPGAMPQDGSVATTRAIARHIGTALSSYRLLYSFRHGSDGQHPEASLIDVNGTLYGTTYYGGKYDKGTAFIISTTGREHVLLSFGKLRADGQNPSAGLIDAGGTLYGTTTNGGKYDTGTAFSISTTGTEHVLHSFGYPDDGGFPAASLIDVKGTLYGTTTSGGQYLGGTVFSISTAGSEQVLHSFGYPYDGGSPYASLIDVKGTLYGTTYEGGTHGNQGTVFSISTTGTEHVLHSFGYPNDGALPVASLVDVSGTLYGTTTGGGQYGQGTVFSISTTGTEHVLHSFDYPNDGALPAASLIGVKGTLYGTTVYGGPYGGSFGSGTVFSITTSGAEHVLHNFGNPDDGAYPVASLTDVKGTLYGTTGEGGTHGNRGTVFASRP